MDSSYLANAILTQEHSLKIGLTFAVINLTLVISPLVYNVFIKVLKICPQLVAMFLGCIAGVILASFPELASLTDINLARDPVRIMCFYFPVIILKHIYYTDTYTITKAAPQILLTSIIGWFLFVFCFGFLLITFVAGHAVSIHIIALAGLCFVPIEVSTDLFELDKLNYLEIIMYGEVVLGTAFSLQAYDWLNDHFKGHHLTWYAPLYILFKEILMSFILGPTSGMISGYLFQRHCKNSISCTIFLCSTIFLLYNFCEYLVASNPELTCFIYVYCINKKRSVIPRDVDRDICKLIKLIYNFVSITINFAMLAILFSKFFHLYSFVSLAVSVAVYTCGNAIRFIIFLLISPILSRIGFGCNFNVLITMVWGIRKGPASVLLLLMICQTKMREILGDDLIHLGVNYMLMVNFINGLTLNFLMRKLGISEFVYKNATNLKNALNYLKKRKVNHLMIQKMNRFYSDSNWTLIEEATSLDCGRNIISAEEEEEEDDENVFKNRITSCKTCKVNVVLESSKQEFLDMLREVKLRVLKSIKVSLARQFEIGYLDSYNLKAMHYAVQQAINDENAQSIKIDKILNVLKKKKQIKLTNKLKFLYNLTTEHFITPKKKFIFLSKTIRSRLFRNSFYFIIIANSILILIFLFVNWNEIYVQCLNVLFFLLFSVEFMAKSWANVRTSYLDGFKFYYNYYWNKMFFRLLICDSIELTIELICLNFETREVYLNVFKYLRLYRLLRLLKVFFESIPTFIFYFNKYKDQELVHNVIMAKAIIISYFNVVEVLPKITDNKKIQSIFRKKLEIDRNLLYREFGHIERELPWITISVRTHQGLISVIKIISYAIAQLQNAGLVDSYEIKKLEGVLSERWKSIMSFKMVPNITPKEILFEVPWIANDSNIFEFLYKNVSLRVWDAGDIVYMEDDVAEGVIVIVSGMFKISYIPEKYRLEMLKTLGILPVKECLKDTKFHLMSENFVTKGNSIGELSVITGRPYDCRIVAEIPTQAYIIPAKIIKEALKLNCDAIYGLWSKIWKHISINLAKTLFKDSSFYGRISYYQMSAVIHRCFIPNVKNYKMMVLNDFVEHVVLIEGTVTNAVTKEQFIAPCNLPRKAQKLLFEEPKSIQWDYYNRKPILILIPLRDVDENEVMAVIEAASEYERRATLTFRVSLKDGPASNGSGVSFENPSDSSEKNSNNVRNRRRHKESVAFNMGSAGISGKQLIKTWDASGFESENSEEQLKHTPISDFKQY